MQRNQKTVSLIYLACGAVSFVLFREVMASVWMWTGVALPVDWLVSPTDMIAFAIGIVTFIVLIKNAKVVEFTNDVISELGRVVWPDRKETVLSTGVVSVLVGICSMIFFLFDMLWGTLVKFFYN